MKQKIIWSCLFFLLLSPVVIFRLYSKKNDINYAKNEYSSVFFSTPLPEKSPVQPVLQNDPGPTQVAVASPTPVQTPTLTPSPNPKRVVLSGGPKILMYHYIRSGIDINQDKVGYNLSISPDNFEKQLQSLKNANSRVVTVSEMVNGPIDSNEVAISFDDGYEDFYTNAFPLLQKYGFAATVYVITGKIGDQYLSWEQINEMSQKGIEIGSHTVNHKELDKLGLSDQRYEISQSKKDLEDHLGKPITSFCYPVGRYNQQTIDLVKEAGYNNAVVTKAGKYNPQGDHFTIQRIRVSP